MLMCDEGHSQRQTQGD